MRPIAVSEFEGQEWLEERSHSRDIGDGELEKDGDDTPRLERREAEERRCSVQYVKSRRRREMIEE